MMLSWQPKVKLRLVSRFDSARIQKDKPIKSGTSCRNGYKRINMKTFSRGEVSEMLSHCDVDECMEDNQGQLVFYTGVFAWADGTFRDEEDPSLNCPGDST